MLKNKTKLLLIVLMVISIALSPFCYADDENKVTNEKTVETPVQEQTEENTNTEENKLVQENAEQEEQTNSEQPTNIKQGDEYLIGDSVTVDSVIDGNLYVTANELTIDAQVVGNVFACAKKIKITEKGYVSSSLYALAEDIEINGIAYDVYSSSENISISGYIYRDIHTVSNNFNLYGTVGRNAFTTSKNYSFQKLENPGTDEEYISAMGQVSGKFDYYSDKEIEIPQNVVSGEIKYNHFSTVNSKNYFISAIAFILLVIAVWTVLTWLAPKFLKNSSNLITNKIYKTIGYGLITLIAVPIFAAILLIAKITASIGLFTLATYVVLCGISAAIFTIAINNLITNKLKIDTTLKTLLLLVITSIVLWATTLIPVVGAICCLIYIITGIGIIIRNLVSKKEE